MCQVHGPEWRDTRPPHPGDEAIARLIREGVARGVPRWALELLHADHRYRPREGE